MRFFFISSLALISTMALMACSNNDSSGSGSGNTASSPSSSYPIKAKSELTEAQKQEIKSIVGNFENLPGTNLLLRHENESSADAEKYQKEIAELSGVKKTIFEDLKKNCDIDVLKPVKTGSADHTGAKEQSLTEGGIRGDRCPLRLNHKESSVRTAVSSNLAQIREEFEQTKDPKVYDKLAEVFDFHSSTTEEATINDPSLQDQTGLKSALLHFDANGNTSYAMKRFSSRFKMTGKIEYQTVSGQTVLVEMLMDIATSSVGDPGKSTEDSYIEGNFHFPSSSSIIQVYATPDGTRQYYLNGKPSSLEEMRSIFGPKMGSLE